MATTSIPARPTAALDGRAETTSTARTGAFAASAIRSTLITVTVGEILVQLALSPVTAVVPGLAAAVGVSAADGAWILTVFILALAGTLLVSGRLGDLLGHRRVFGVGAVVYAVAALAAGLTSTFEALLLARGAQGIGAAMISGNNLAILTRAVPTEQRGRAIATVATASSLSAVLGSGLGTAAVAMGGWPLLFIGTVPLALWAAVRARRLPGAPPRGDVVVDWPGAALLVVAITLAAVALNHPHTTASDVVMPVFHTWLPLAAGLAAAAFIVVERRAAVPLMDWRQLRARAFAAAVTVNGVLHMTMMAAMFLGPVLVVRGLGLDTTAGGMLMVVVQTSTLLTAPLGGWLYDRTRSRWLRPGAASVVALGLVAWAVAGLSGSYTALLLAGLAAGLGNGVLLAVNNTVVMGSLPDHSRGVASGMLETTRHFGHAFGVTLPTAILAVAVAGAAPGGEPEALRQGFFWACLAMAAVASMGAAMATVRARAA